MRYRVLLCQSEGGIGIDIGLGGSEYEEFLLSRSTIVEFASGINLRVASAEDLVVMKVFAGRPRDWEDVRGILIRQGASLSWETIWAVLPELLNVIEEMERLSQLTALRSLLADD